MNRSTAWFAPFATLALSTAAHAADSGFYFAATASRVEHDVEGRPGLPIAVIVPGPPPGGILPPVAEIIGRPPGGVLNPIALFPTAVDVDEVDTGFSATVGYRMSRYLAAELSYVDFGEYAITEQYSFGSTKYELGVRGPSLALLGSLPLGEQWELFVRGGVLFADQEMTLKTSSSGPTANGGRDFSDEVIIAGAGVQWSFAQRWAARLEYQVTDDMRYDNTGESSIDQASLSVLFKL